MQFTACANLVFWIVLVLCVDLATSRVLHFNRGLNNEPTGNSMDRQLIREKRSIDCELSRNRLKQKCLKTTCLLADYQSVPECKTFCAADPSSIACRNQNCYEKPNREPWTDWDECYIVCKNNNQERVVAVTKKENCGQLNVKF
ncbi:hypothetical protein M3Y95_01177200 [Aphelenchoides besseyi]|nr:hypothetical protein M3Y95_01177200 [Aphelenchoides besseyi]